MAVAGRLSENPSITVAVLEAGMNVEDFPEVSAGTTTRIHYTHRIQVFIPGLIGTGKGKGLNWAYRTIPQEHLSNRQVTVSAGKALGGGTISTSNWLHSAK
jgi:hypothetical protein